MDQYWDEDVIMRSMTEAIRSILRQGFCMTGRLGIQDKDEWEKMQKLDDIPYLDKYGLTPPRHFPVGISEEQGRADWFKDAKRNRPEWYQGVHSEDVNVEWSRRYGAKLVFTHDFNTIVSQGKLEAETAQEFTERLRRCFKLTEKGEADFLRRQFQRTDEIPAASRSLTPTQLSSADPAKMPTALTRVHLENLMFFRHYVEELI
ncbi:MAG: hypothetical protein GY820_02265, partial [Gammaproteobacteria bacterium]|nr:hypothetical protein [Gammaproteobacteria bacterium]